NREFARLFKLIKLLKSLKPDIVHTYLFSANSYGRIASMFSGVPIIIASERNLPEIGMDKSLYQICLDRFLLFFSHGLICNSYKAAGSLVNKYFFDEKKVFTVHNGINIDEFWEKSSSHNICRIAPKVVGTVGRLWPQKNHKVFLDMAKKVLDRTKEKNVKFLIVGDGPLRNVLENYSKQLQIENNVTFTGERTDVPALLHGMDIFVMTSLYEGMSNAIMEAMLSGLPVVATAVGGNSELVIDGKTGFLYPPNDSGMIVEKVVSLINNEKMAKEMGDNGRKKISDEFGINKMLRETEKIYLKLLTQ
ncbi:MAG TPA: glycosyltransferase, partial [Syntrophales bacterium]|nr:glycosyltransferase [Syntrophales bacterium]